MTREMLYRPKGAGHSAPEGDRRHYRGPKQPLVDAFSRWYPDLPDKDRLSVEEQEKLYSDALELISRTEARVGPGDPEAIIEAFPDEFMAEGAGLFISAAHNLMEEDVIEFRPSVAISHPGYRLSPGKTLFLYGDTSRAGTRGEGILVNCATADTFGIASECLLVNRGKVRGGMGMNSRGPAINYGTCEDGMGFQGGGMNLNYGYAGSMGMAFNNCFINFGMTNNIECYEWCVIVNMGEAEVMHGSNESYVIAIRNPREEPRNGMHTEFVMREDECRENPRLLEYFEGIRDRFGPEKPLEGMMEEMQEIKVREKIDELTDIKSKRIVFFDF